MPSVHSNNKPLVLSTFRKPRGPTGRGGGGGGQGQEGERREAEDLTVRKGVTEKGLWEEPITKRAKLFKIEISENLFTTYADLQE